jgi:hypothetical protein
MGTISLNKPKNSRLFQRTASAPYGLGKVHFFLQDFEVPLPARSVFARPISRLAMQEKELRSRTRSVQEPRSTVGTIVLGGGSAHLDQFKVFNALKVSLPREQGQTVSQSNASDQAVTHSDCLAGPVELTPNFSSMTCGGAVEGQHIERIKQLANGATSFAFVSAIEKLKTGNSRCLELFSRDVFGDLILRRLDADQEVDQQRVCQQESPPVLPEFPHRAP